MGQSDNPASYIGSACLELKKIATASGLHFISHLLDMTALEATKEQMKGVSENQLADRGPVTLGRHCPPEATRSAPTWDEGTERRELRSADCRGDRPTQLESEGHPFRHKIQLKSSFALKRLMFFRTKGATRAMNAIPSSGAEIGRSTSVIGSPRLIDKARRN